MGRPPRPADRDRLMRRALATLVALFALAPAPAFADAHAWAVKNPKATCDFPGDGLTLVVKRETGKLVRTPYCSAYGRGKVRVVNDARDQTWVLVETSEGRGARRGTTAYLVVYRLGAKLTEQSRVKLSQAWGVQSRWRYDYQVNRPEDGGLELVLRLQTIGDGPQDALPEQTKIVRVKRSTP
jgi:hypothetical protein